jgi:hypothetical protein
VNKLNSDKLNKTFLNGSSAVSIILTLREKTSEKKEESYSKIDNSRVTCSKDRLK